MNLLKESITLKALGQNIDFSVLNQEVLNGWLNIACKDGDLVLVRYLLTSKQLSIHPNVHGDIDHFNDSYDEMPLYYAAKYGHRELIEYLCTSEELTEHVNLRCSDDAIVYILAEDNNVEMIEFLANNEKIKNKPQVTAFLLLKLCFQKNSFSQFKYFLHNKKYNIDLNEQVLDSLLKTSCENGLLKNVEYLLTTPELKINPTITTTMLDEVVSGILLHNQIKMVKYLLKQVVFKNYLETFIEDKKLGLQFIIDIDHTEILELLLCSVINTDKLKKIICTYAHDDLICHIVNKWNIDYNDDIVNLDLQPSLRKAFEARQLNDKLYGQLIINPIKNNKLKL